MNAKQRAYADRFQRNLATAVLLGVTPSFTVSLQRELQLKSLRTVARFYGEQLAHFVKEYETLRASN